MSEITIDHRKKNLLRILTSLDERSNVVKKHVEKKNWKIRTKGQNFMSLIVGLSGGRSPSFTAWCDISKYKSGSNLIRYGVSANSELVDRRINAEFSPSSMLSKVRFPNQIAGYTMFESVPKQNEIIIAFVEVTMDGTTTTIPEKRVEDIATFLGDLTKLCRIALRNSGLAPLHQ